ncbi:hypothetical protein Pan181_24710 [Aeoliella mucimassa]|uniref:Ser-Thr-rich glycosyl-phosphatidyl-inositol-anchored membrane family protein n=2 Tax=Aeoliella mucimassa TaxID=2527972 RepID=A0A518ANH0_9BACT|nr:hypothetical protein Pan181_24710 [Aeoliella mucimassa]
MVLAALANSTLTYAQTSALPDPVYWSQQVFVIPYQWDNTNAASDAVAVKLYLSQDQGRTWNEISQAKPELQGFNYHAPSDGEYWFSIRTFDSQGRAWPEGPYQPELRVIVDTQNPTIQSLTAALTPEGMVTANWQATDSNFDPPRASMQYRLPESPQWQSVPLNGMQSPSPNVLQGSVQWQVPTSAATVYVRLAVRDKAGNVQEAGAEARVGGVPNTQLANTTRRMPPLHRAETWPSDGQSQVPLGAPPASAYQSITTNTGAPPRSNSLASLPSLNTNTPLMPRESVATNSPFRLPSLSDSQAAGATTNTSLGLSPPELSRPQNSPLGNPLGNPPSQVSGGWNTQGTAPSSGGVGMGLPNTSNRAPSTSLPIQYLNRTEFEIGYNVDMAGTAGVTRVELWGTENGGQSWQRLAVDTDNRSPILVAVPKPGDYGLAIVVATAGGIDPVRPRPGDEPQMMVRVDTTAPVARFTGIQQGTGQFADRLQIDWQPGDPTEAVLLSYSSSPSGPWISIANQLPNTGQYSWRLGRHLPEQLYLRIDTRDLSGNTSTDQTGVPVQISLPTPSGTLGAVRGL